MAKARGAARTTPKSKGPGKTKPKAAARPKKAAAASSKPAAKGSKPPAKSAPAGKPASAPVSKAPAVNAKKGGSKSPAPAANKPAAAATTTAKPAPATDSKLVAKKPKPKLADLMPFSGKPLSSLVRKPLIQSGPKAPPVVSLESMAAGANGQSRKTPLTKQQLQHFRTILVRKRSELIGDVSTMEAQALTGNSGALSHAPQHTAEQGSEVYEQSLALDLAAADRRLIKEIDDAIKRIDEGTYGLCEITGKPIKIERLDELPWARLSIEAARELERRSASLRTHAPQR